MRSRLTGQTVQARAVSCGSKRPDQLLDAFPAQGLHRALGSLRAGQNLSVSLACQCFVASNLNNLYPHIYPQAGLGPRRWPANDDIHCVRDSL